MTTEPIISVVTGANSGIGRATALHLAGLGHRVYGTMRSLDKGAKLAELAEAAGGEVTPVVLDVADDDSVAAGFAQILADAGHVDVLVNNAGVGSNGGIEDVDIAAAKELFEANVWGVLRCTMAVVPSMRERRSGTIVQISSIAGRVGLPGQPVYSASKWAVEGMSENLAHDLAGFGIRVRIVEPGVTRTAILSKDVAVPEITNHGGVYGRMMDLYATGIVANVRPEAVAETVAEAIADDSAKLRWPVAWGADALGRGRENVASDAEWVELGTLADDGAAWRARFTEVFGIPLIDATDLA
jgi:NAD(P)-dependent dehydrogenase (short-subunit alcohol dehydrogenase family)